MAIIVNTSRPKELLSDIKKAIDDKKIDTWEYDKDGDFTHSPIQWKRKAWLRPHIERNELRFGILKPKGSQPTTILYGVYHGRFIEMLLNHFETEFTTVLATALVSEPDVYTN